jgi:preprotein translocase subunit SecA
MNRHREVIYEQRRRIIDGEDLKEHMIDLIEHQVEVAVAAQWPEDRHAEPDYEEIINSLTGILGFTPQISVRDLQDRSLVEITEILQDKVIEIYDKREAEIGSEEARTLERLILLQTIDKLWVEHLTAMDHMRQGINLQAYGQRDPLVEYKSQGFRMFQSLLQNIEYDVSHLIFKVRLNPVMARPMARPGITNHPAEAGPARRKAREKVGRNDPCPCGSGKKYKNCHGAPDAVRQAASIR